MKRFVHDEVGRLGPVRIPVGGGDRARLTDSRGAFTLVEVVLAVGIAVGLLFVVMFFYRQAAGLREQVLRETERIAAIRLVMDQLTTDLRGVPPRVFYGAPLIGDAQGIELVKTDLPGRANWTGGELGRAPNPETDLRLIRYSLGDGTNAFGFIRSEEPLVAKREAPAMAGAVSAPEDMIEWVPLPLTDEIQFVHFRFWDGSGWMEQWNAPTPPLAVEISLGSEALPADIVPEEYPYELFRRVVCLPTGGQPAEEPAVVMELEVSSAGEMK